MFVQQYKDTEVFLKKKIILKNASIKIKTIDNMKIIAAIFVSLVFLIKSTVTK
jgi:hypothetical protein